MKLQFNFRNLTTRDLNEKFFEKIAQKVFEEEKSARDAYLDLAIVGSQRMQKLNRRFRGKNRSTDVLAFQSESSRFPSQLLYLGEVVICYQVVVKEAKRRNLDLDTELVKVVAHGILHLLGYDHEKSKKEEKIMLEKEEKIVKLCREI